MSEQTIPSKNNLSSKKLEGNLINIGIYGAIYCVLMTAMAMIGSSPSSCPLCAFSFLWCAASLWCSS